MIDLTQTPENMIPVYLVREIYDIRDTQAEDEKDFDQIIVNDTILEIIDRVNFTYVKDGLEPTEVIKKVGYLMNLTVYLDPHRESNNIIFTNDKNETLVLEVKL